MKQITQFFLEDESPTLKISQNSQENTCARILFLITMKIETLARVFSCEFCEIFKNTFFYRTPLDGCFCI